jgi:hypothetical protein
MATDSKGNFGDIKQTVQANEGKSNTVTVLIRIISQDQDHSQKSNNPISIYLKYFPASVHFRTEQILNNLKHQLLQQYFQFTIYKSSHSSKLLDTDNWRSVFK